MKTFYEAIHEWVAENFGQSEADDPSWNIEDLEEDELVRRVLDYWDLGGEDWIKGVM